MSFNKFDIHMMVGGLPFNEHSLGEKGSGLGGSESAGLYMAKEFASLGASVSLFCTTPDNAYGTGEDGVTYLPLPLFAEQSVKVPHDVTIVQRAPEAFAVRSASALNVLWCHDLALGRMSTGFRGALWNIDKVAVLSKFMAEQYKGVYGLHDDQLLLTRNGIDLAGINAVHYSKSKADRIAAKTLVYSSRPERGLDVLLGQVMPLLLQMDPEWQLVIAGYNNPVPHLADFYARCSMLASRLGDRVKMVGALSKPDLWKLFKTSTALVYPTPSPFMKDFAEVSCITAMEAQACGLPIITNDVGALAETIHPDAGFTLPVDTTPEQFAQTILRQCSTHMWNRAHDAGRERASELSWSGVASQWLRFFEQSIRSRAYSNPHRMLRHLWRQSDIVAAKEFAAQSGNIVAKEAERLLADWSFMDKPDGYRIQYETIGAGHDDYVIDTVPHEPRFKILARFLAENFATCRTVLDYGCAHGAYATRLAEAVPGVEIKGVDIDRFSIAMAQGFAEKLNVTNRVSFETWPDGIPETPARLFDLVLAQEVLEHVPEPWKVMDDLERHGKMGGHVHITVPFGPWEYSSYHTYPHRCHIWHFSRHDLVDMFGAKDNLQIEAYHHADSPELGEPMGWWIVSYKINGEPCGKVDIERKMWLQAPRDTVSAQILGGPGCEETLLWTMRSLQHVADEIRLIDCGLSEMALQMARMCGATVIKGEDPKRIGFDEARNIGLNTMDKSKMDWVLWIDSDEKLINPSIIHKYLRANGFNGYGIRQHHFAVDTAFPPDMPVRLFRTRPLPGRPHKEMKFYGVIHEHPEMELNSGPGIVVVMSDVHIAHVGYLAEGIRRDRFARNLPLLQRDMQKNPERLLQKHFIMRDLIHIVRYNMAHNGGKVTEDLRAKLEEVIALYRRHFLGKGQFMNSDSRAYYSEALRLLGRGFDAAFAVSASKENVQPEPHQVYRFDNTEDFVTEMSRMARDKASAFDAKWY